MTTHINPDLHLVTALKLPKDQAGKAYVRILSSARRCQRDFTLRMPNTDYHLLLESELSEFTHCLIEKSFEGIYDHSHIQVLPAWPRNEYSQQLYEDTEQLAQSYVAAELRRVADYLPSGKRVTRMTWKESVYRVAKLQHHFNNDTLREVAQFLELLKGRDIDNRRVKVAKHLKRLANQLEELRSDS